MKSEFILIPDPSSAHLPQEAPIELPVFPSRDLPCSVDPHIHSILTKVNGKIFRKFLLRITGLGKVHIK